MVRHCRDVLLSVVVFMMTPFLAWSSTSEQVSLTRPLHLGGAATSTSGRKEYRVVQVQIVHRHGDRTPITPLRDEDFWASSLVSPEVLEKIDEGTTLLRDGSNNHKALGMGAFGKLTQLGLLQMIELGTRIREELVGSQEDDRGQPQSDTMTLWCDGQSFKPDRLRVYSTNFPRTIQSVQALLIGLFPDKPAIDIAIDCRHTNWMIPDPQPRNTKEQEELERKLASQPHILEREAELSPLAKRIGEALRPLLAEDALETSFGVEEVNKNTGQERKLSWTQMAEVLECLKVRNVLPKELSDADLDDASSHAAWRWFEVQKHPRLTFLAMNKFASFITDGMKQYEEEPPLTIFSCHDSSLIGLISAFRLRKPMAWPEYASCIKIELLQVSGGDPEEPSHVVRFYLNGELLPSEWFGEHRDEIPLELLCEYIAYDGILH